MSFDLSLDILAVLMGSMRIHYSGADPSEDRGCTELLPRIVVFEWNKQAANINLSVLHFFLPLYHQHREIARLDVGPTLEDH